MGQRGRTGTRKEAPKLKALPVGRQRVLPVVEILVDADQALRELVVETGMQVLAALLEEDRVAICGPRSQPQADRRAYRYGFDRGHLVLGGRKVSVGKPRCRSVDGEELTLPSWQAMAAEDPLRRRVVEQMLIGVSTRKYERSLEELPVAMKSVASKKSSVSRRFVACTRRHVEEFLGRSLEGLNLPVLMFDGTELGGHLMIVALGIDADGTKHVLGVREGATESAEVCKSLVRELIDRGLVVEQARLLVIDGSKGLHKALKGVFGRWGHIQRCQIHKMRNVQEHLPKSRWPWVRQRLRQAWLQSDSEEQAEKRLLSLAQSLEEVYPGAAASIREGLRETLTLLRLGLPASDPLHRTLRSTNPIENLQGLLQTTARRVKRWTGGSMALRWAVGGILEAERRFRRVKGFRAIPRLVVALEDATEDLESTIGKTTRKVA
jgi:putative transposase